MINVTVTDSWKSDVDYQHVVGTIKMSGDYPAGGEVFSLRGKVPSYLHVGEAPRDPALDYYVPVIYPGKKVAFFKSNGNEHTTGAYSTEFVGSEGHNASVFPFYAIFGEN